MSRLAVAAALLATGFASAFDVTAATTGGNSTAGACTFPGAETGFAASFNAAVAAGCSTIHVGPGIATIDDAIVQLDLHNVEIVFEHGLEIKPDAQYWSTRYWRVLNAFQNNLGILVLGGTGVHVTGVTEATYTGNSAAFPKGVGDRPVMMTLYKVWKPTSLTTTTSSGCRTLLTNSLTQCTDCSVKNFQFVDSPFVSFLRVNA